MTLDPDAQALPTVRSSGAPIEQVFRQRAFRTGLAAVDLTRAGTRIVHPISAYAPPLPDSGSAGNPTADAHPAALAIEHGAAPRSFDRDFGRFDGLRFERLRR